ncbi:MAG: tRNA (adenosine(37)-N6)-threonylcarbamoyltransferase complex dimerization subunit type 1 TsaB [Dehalococcoidia bacterium]|nr:tRNA (adenosine(37)-N6)-threonylcarbamoyltransferase complex dimerization subunit type 1 TsaB [Dehalococcoidia bacterium]
MELSIDTSTDIATIALSHLGKVRAEFTWVVGMNHTTQLMPTIERMLKACDTVFAQVEAVFVGLGPGSFAGIRVAMATAKGLALSLSVPIVGISTLEIEAYPFACTSLPICAIHDAGRNELAVAMFQQVSGQWRTLDQDRLTSLEALCAETSTRTVFCGEMSEQVAERLRLALGDSAVIPGTAARLRRAGMLAELGWARLQLGHTDDTATLQPTYIRRPHITVPKQHAWPV